ncbi:helix-turn-helix domain-containing protein [Haloarchaeobius amylolyticus]|uniref:Helix-turn-helix domain-containing protein n=1 Tax=Haloarchaeobius amylolyticus TaxID=1198296 RepID=A0ABD6BIY6_9EURY
MDVEEFRSLIETGEGKKVEFKSSQILREPNGENRYKIAKELVALANRRGGHLIFGIDDESNELENNNLIEYKSRNTISSISSDKCSPPINFECYYFNDELEGQSQVFVVEVEPKEQIPHSIVDNSEGEVQKREYRIRTGEDSRLVTDSELYSLFRGYTGQRIENGSATFLPLDLDQHAPKYAEPYPDGFKSFDRFLSRISNEEWDLIINDVGAESVEDRVQKLIAELFPFAVLDSLPADFWIHCFGNDFGSEEIDDMYDEFGYITLKELKYEQKSQNQSANLLISELDLDPIQILREERWSLHIPKGTNVTLDHIDPYNACLSFEKGEVLNCNLSLGGVTSNPVQGLHEKHPLSDLISDSNIFSPTLTTWIEGTFGYPDVEDSQIREHQIYVESLYEMTDRLWDWNRCLNEADSMDYRIEHRLEEIDEKIDRLFQTNQSHL